MKPAIAQFLSRAAIFAVLSGYVCAQSSAPNTTVTTSDGPKKLSRDLSASLTASLPRYTEPKPPEPAPEPAAAVVQEQAADTPRNGIVRLPRYIVEGDRPPVFRERDIYTRDGLGKLAAQRYLSQLDRNGLNKYTLPLFGTSAEQRALTQYYEDERLKEMNSANEKVYLLRQTDPAAAGQLQKEVNDTFMRRSDFGPTSTSIGGKP